MSVTEYVTAAGRMAFLMEWRAAAAWRAAVEARS